MPIHEFKCRYGHVTEKLFLTFDEADEVDWIVCPECVKQRRSVDTRDAVKILSVPGRAIFYGGGWGSTEGSSSPSYKRSDPDKAATDVLKEFGAKAIQGAVKGAGK